MSKRVVLVGIFISLWVISWADNSSAEFELSVLEPIQRSDRILILAPHPDDETIGCAGVIQEAVRVGADTRVVFLTNGDHNQFSFIVYEKRIILRKGAFIHMGELRRREAVNAMGVLGLPKSKLIFLGYPDFGTFTIFERYWQAKRPFKSLLTRISSVPYPENFSYGSLYVAENILRDLKELLLRYKPNKIFVSHPADTNSDHKAFYLFLQVALQDLSGKLPLSLKVYTYLIHAYDWPLPRHYHPELPLIPPKIFQNGQIQWYSFKLTPQQVKRKHQALLCHKTQTCSSAFYLLSFVRQNELFGDYSPVELVLGTCSKDSPHYSDSFNSFFNSAANKNIENSQGLEVGFGDKVNYGIDDSSKFLIKITKDKGINRRFNSLVYIFGYNHSQNFANMPKLRIYYRYNRIICFSGGKRISSSDITFELKPEEFLLRIPLEKLGNPEIIWLMLKVYGDKELSATGIRRINLKKGVDDVKL